jgi:hypothetical protein
MIAANFVAMHSEYALANLRVRNCYPSSLIPINGILEFQLLSFDKCIKVQLICWNIDARSLCAEELGHMVIHSFDISVCRVAMTSSKELSKYYFCDHQDAIDIYLHRFSMQMKPRERTSIVFGRILKYTDRGFQLYKLKFRDGNISGLFIITERFDAEE